MKIGTVTPTLGDRPIFLNRLKERLNNQTRKADVSVFVDHKGNGKVDIRERYIKGIKECFDKGCDLVLFIEDDDYYPLTYIEEMSSEWERLNRPNIFGVKTTTYYQIVSNRFVNMSPNHSSAYCTGIGSGAKYEVGAVSSPYYDIAIWAANKGPQVELKNPPLGIKHGLGRCGGVGHDINSRLYMANIDLDMSLLRQRVDKESFNFYNKLAGNRIGVVIVSYETPKDLEKAVSSVKNAERTEVLIVDNSKKDSPCYKKADELAKNNVKVIHTGANIYHGKGLHFGIERLNTEYILVMDSDVEVFDTSILNTMVKELADPNLYAIGADIEAVPEGTKMYGIGFDYLNPFFGMFKRETYFKHPPFIHHGAPWCQAMIAIKDKLKVKAIKNYSKYVIHNEGQTRKVTDREWLKGWDKLNIDYKKKNDMKIGKDFKLKKGIVLRLNYGSPIVLKSNTITNELAVEHLKSNPSNIMHFEEVPDWWVNPQAKTDVKPKERNVTVFCFVYNERDYLPHVYEFWKRQGISMYVIDNMSNDGTWEWLQLKNIPSHRFDTQDKFQLAWLQKELVRTLHVVKPDWIIYGAADLYYAFDKSIKEVIDQAESQGYNQVRTHCWFTCPTDTEKRKLPLIENYPYCEPFSDINMISKYDPNISFLGDHIQMPNAKALFVEGIIINTGNCKPIEIQEEKLARRKKAWESGMHKGWGVHYNTQKAKNWLYTKEELFDIRTSAYSKYYTKILELCKPLKSYSGSKRATTSI